MIERKSIRLCQILWSRVLQVLQTLVPVLKNVKLRAKIRTYLCSRLFN
jgi:hypothetical protein